VTLIRTDPAQSGLGAVFGRFLHRKSNSSGSLAHNTDNSVSDKASNWQIVALYSISKSVDPLNTPYSKCFVVDAGTGPIGTQVLARYKSARAK